MKVLVLVCLCLYSIHAIAEGDFNLKKQEILGNIDKKISALQDHKSCVSAASTKEEMKVCHDKMKEKQAEFKKCFKEKHKDWIKKREQKQ